MTSQPPKKSGFLKSFIIGFILVFALNLIRDFGPRFLQTLSPPEMLNTYTNPSKTVKITFTRTPYGKRGEYGPHQVYIYRVISQPSNRIDNETTIYQSNRMYEPQFSKWKDNNTFELIEHSKRCAVDIYGRSRPRCQEDEALKGEDKRTIINLDKIPELKPRKEL